MNFLSLHLNHIDLQIDENFFFSFGEEIKSNQYFIQMNLEETKEKSF